MAADDTTVVGSFNAPGAGDVYQLSSCTPPEVSTTTTTEINTLISLGMIKLHDQEGFLCI